MSEIINRVAQSPLVSLDLEQHYPKAERVAIDLAPLLENGFLLREKILRQWVKEHDWQQYAGKAVHIHCSADALIPTWAWMLLASRLAPVAETFVQGDEAVLEQALWQKTLAALNLTAYANKPVVVKGCSNRHVPAFAYTELTRLLQPVVKNLMFGEPCSTVPVYKQKTPARN